MSAIEVDGRFSSVLCRAALLRLKSKAFRSGAWFKVLKNAERALVEATIRVVDQVRSPVVVNALLSVVGKLLDASKSRVEVAVKEFGLPYAHKLGSLALKWGNESARRWMFDLAFARYIAIMHINSHDVCSHGSRNNPSSMVETC